MSSIHSLCPCCDVTARKNCYSHSPWCQRAWPHAQRHSRSQPTNEPPPPPMTHTKSEPDPAHEHLTLLPHIHMYSIGKSFANPWRPGCCIPAMVGTPYAWPPGVCLILCAHAFGWQEYPPPPLDFKKLEKTLQFLHVPLSGWCYGITAVGNGVVNSVTAAACKSRSRVLANMGNIKSGQPYPRLRTGDTPPVNMAAQRWVIWPNLIEQKNVFCM